MTFTLAHTPVQTFLQVPDFLDGFLPFYRWTFTRRKLFVLKVEQHHHRQRQQVVRLKNIAGLYYWLSPETIGLLCKNGQKNKNKNLGKCYKTVFYILKIYFRMSKLRKCAILRKISAHFELLAAMHLKKIGQGLVHHCVTSCPLLKTFWAIYFSCFSPLTQNVVAWGEAQLSTERSEPPFNPNAVSHWVKTVTFQTRKPNKGVRRQWNVHKSWS